MTNSEKYKDCLEYIDNYWNKIIFKPSRIHLKYSFINIPTLIPAGTTDPHSIYIPYQYFVPNTEKFKRIYYWDSYFMFKGLIGTKRQKLTKSMVNNFLYLFKKYRIIPNFNAPASINRSQPPFLTSMILDSYLTPLEIHKTHRHRANIASNVYKFRNSGWFKSAINIAKKEYETVWIDKANLYNHHVQGYMLSRYGDRDIGYAHSSELESGWDMTSRFYNRCDQFLPIDLNSYLYKYEKDFESAAQLLKNRADEKYWSEKAQMRKKEINKYMWNKDDKFFFDYGYAFKQQSNFLSLASYTPLWAGLASFSQAKEMAKKLHKFETPYGLTISSKDSLAKPIDLSKIQRRYHPSIEEIIKPKQWDYPNIWSPLEYLTVIGLLKYGFVHDSKRIMENSLHAHATLFRKHNTFFEKINGATGAPGTGALYGDQTGFGWTNAIFYRYVDILDSLDKLESIYIENTTKHMPPYTLAIPH
ncbi:MAG TPA: trehalase family glycosidase [Candidatus Saccharimonadales bacterium]|nr:trehalase family glycosidase [Candidatus Saccharimonadales bacterium]